MFNYKEKLPLAYLPGERWAQALAPGYYASSKGRIWSFRSKKLLKPWLTSRAIYSIQLAGKIYPLSHVIYEAFHKERPKVISYNDNNSLNCELENLKPETKKETIDDLLKTLGE